MTADAQVVAVDPIRSRRGPPSNDPGAVMTNAGGKTSVDVMIVDDNGGVRTLLRKLGERDGDVRFVAEASDGVEAIEMAAERQPDVVILDVDMPVLDGVGAIAGILEAAPHTRILMHSAFTDERERAMANGAHGWASKGQSWDEIRQLITEVLAAPTV